LAAVLRQAQGDARVSRIVTLTRREHPTYVRVGQKLVEWVRNLGIDDPAVDPNHGWRHRFKTEGKKHGMEREVLDAILGHAPRTVGDGYGSSPPDLMYPEIIKQPRFRVTPATTTDRRTKQVRSSGVSATRAMALE
jgi:hypothetical protein